MDLRRIYLLQGIRAFTYGFTSVLIGTSLSRAGLSGTEVGLVFGSMLAGSAIASIGLVRRADRLGRRRVYAILYAVMAVAGAVVAFTSALPLLVLAGLTGTLSVEVVESGPFTSVEQAMIPDVAKDRAPHAFGTYNAVAALVGAFGALVAGGPELLREAAPGLPPEQRWLLVYAIAGVLGVWLIRGLTDAVEPRPDDPPGSRRLRTSRRAVSRLAALFALDSFAGGFIVQSFLVYWFAERFGASNALMGAVLGTMGLIQAGSFVLAPRIAARVGLLNTMVFTHLPSNLLLALIPFAPNLGVAIALLLIRFPLSQMDVPTRQAYLAYLAGPSERAAAASVTNAARTVARPLGAPLAGAAVASSIPGLPFFVAGGLKVAYDLMLYAWFRHVPIEEPLRSEPGPAERET